MDNIGTYAFVNLISDFQRVKFMQIISWITFHNYSLPLIYTCLSHDDTPLILYDSNRVICYINSLSVFIMI